jgi:hypothetical protein
MEKIPEEFKMGLDAQKSLAQVYEDGKMNKGIGGEMMQLDSVIVHKSRKEIRTRKTQSLLKIRSKINDFARIFIQTTLA